MKIETITFNPKTDCFDVVTDSQRTYSVSYHFYIEQALHADSEADAALLSLLEAEHARNRAFAVALNYAAYMPRTRHEVTTRLRREGIDPSRAEQCLVRLTELGLLDDAAYAIAYAEDRSRLKRWSRAKIRAKLYDKGIPKDEIDAALAQLPDDDEAEKLTALLASPSFQRRDLNDRRVRDKTIAALMRRGFRFDDIIRAIGEASDD